VCEASSVKPKVKGLKGEPGREDSKSEEAVSIKEIGRELRMPKSALGRELRIARPCSSSNVHVSQNCCLVCDLKCSKH
jgi:hypothetical protein